MHVVGTMSRGLREQQTEPTSDRGSEGRRPDNTTTYSPEQIVSHAAAAGRAAYAAVIRAGRAVALAERAYNRAYIRSIPPCWVALLAHPTSPKAGTLKKHCRQLARPGSAHPGVCKHLRKRSLHGRACSGCRGRSARLPSEVLKGSARIELLQRLAALSKWEKRPSPQKNAGPSDMAKGRGLSYVKYELNRT